MTYVYRPAPPGRVGGIRRATPPAAGSRRVGLGELGAGFVSSVFAKYGYAVPGSTPAPAPAPAPAPLPSPIAKSPLAPFFPTPAPAPAIALPSWAPTPNAPAPIPVEQVPATVTVKPAPPSSAPIPSTYVPVDPIAPAAPSGGPAGSSSSGAAAGSSADTSGSGGAWDPYAGYGPLTSLGPSSSAPAMPSGDGGGFYDDMSLALPPATPPASAAAPASSRALVWLALGGALLMFAPRRGRG